MIVILDFVSLIALVAGTVAVYLMEMKRQRENQTEGEKINTSGILYFSFITDGIITLLFLVKCYYGAKFAKDVICPQRRKKKYEDINQEQAENKIFKVKTQRKSLNWYFIASSVAYFFTIIQTFSLLFLFIGNPDQFIKICVLLIFCVISLLYSQRKILQLLRTKDAELRTRSLHRSESVVHTEGNEEDEQDG